MYASRFSTSVFARIFPPNSVAEEPSSIYPATVENAFISPFVSRVILSSLNNFRAEKSAMEIVMRLNTMTEKFGFTEYLETLGPTPCIISKINGYYRFQILIKNKISQKGHDFVNKFFSKITMPKDIKLSIDVDPLDIL